MPIYALGANRPECHPNTWVAPNASLIGKVVLEEKSSVWFHTNLGPILYGSLLLL